VGTPCVIVSGLTNLGLHFRVVHDHIGPEIFSNPA
jgi:hypothetical protein